MQWPPGPGLAGAGQGRCSKCGWVSIMSTQLAENHVGLALGTAVVPWCPGGRTSSKSTVRARARESRALDSGPAPDRRKAPAPGRRREDSAATLASRQPRTRRVLTALGARRSLALSRSRVPPRGGSEGASCHTLHMSR